MRRGSHARRRACTRTDGGPGPNGRRATVRRRRKPRRWRRSPPRHAPRTRSARLPARSVPYGHVTDEEDPERPRRSRRRTFVRLLGFLRPYRASLVVSSLLAIGSQIAGILVPVLTGIVINELSGDP